MKKLNKKEITEKWIHKNGAASFDLKNQDICLWDGGLFSIEKEPVMRRKIIGCKKKYKDFDYKAVFWFTELDETINYLKRMKKMLNSLGYETGRPYLEEGKMKEVFVHKDFIKKFDKLTKSIQKPINNIFNKLRKDKLSLSRLRGSNLYVKKVKGYVLIFAKQNKNILVIDIMNLEEFYIELEKSFVIKEKKK
jgi:mRNA-degrading endonuclease RelE of RelBE toxin-antitoxin system